MTSNRTCIAMIGDIVHSRRLGDLRANAQEVLSLTLTAINDEFSDAILSKYLITVGDEFQGLLREAGVIPDIIRKLESQFIFGDIRLGIGFGKLDTPAQEYAIGSDGPVWYNARAALVDSKHGGQLGGVFTGFGQAEDAVLNGYARLLHHHRHSMTRREREVTALLRGGMRQTEAAAQLSITPQAVSQYVRTSGWAAYKEGERGWQESLKLFDKPDGDD